MDSVRSNLPYTGPGVTADLLIHADRTGKLPRRRPKKKGKRGKGDVKLPRKSGRIPIDQREIIRGGMSGKGGGPPLRAKLKGLGKASGRYTRQGKPNQSHTPLDATLLDHGRGSGGGKTV